MLVKRNSIEKVTEMGCCGCFGFSLVRNHKKSMRISRETSNRTYRELYNDDMEDDHDTSFRNGDVSDSGNGDDFEVSPKKPYEQILMYKIQNGMICREVPVKETQRAFRSEDENGNKTLNEYIRVRKIAAGSYGKVVLYRSRLDGVHYAIKSEDDFPREKQGLFRSVFYFHGHAFHKSHLLKRRVTPSETAMTDVFREVLIMKVVSHPNIVNLVEVIDDPTADHLYLVLEYVEGKCISDSAGPLEEETARKYLRDVVSGLMYLHSHNIVHGDIKPDNLLITGSGTVKIGDFSVSQVFEDDNDELRRSPGTPAFTAPECCSGPSYHGKAADTWALGITLYFMVSGKYPFLGETLQDTYEKIINSPLVLPEEMNPLLKNLLEGLLCKDPRQRMTLEKVAVHDWFTADEGSIPQYLCWCRRHRLSERSGTNTPI